MATAAKDVQGRRGERRRVLMRGTVFSPDGAHVVWIRDISNDGALIVGDDRFAERLRRNLQARADFCGRPHCLVE